MSDPDPGLGAGREEKMMTETQKILKRLETLLSDPCVYSVIVTRHPGHLPTIVVFTLGKDGSPSVYVTCPDYIEDGEHP